MVFRKNDNIHILEYFTSDLGIQGDGYLICVLQSPEENTFNTNLDLKTYSSNLYDYDVDLITDC